MFVIPASARAPSPVVLMKGTRMISSIPYQQRRDALACAGWAAYGWEGLNPATVDEDAILCLLLLLNRERSEAS